MLWQAAERASNDHSVSPVPKLGVCPFVDEDLARSVDEGISEKGPSTEAASRGAAGSVASKARCSDWVVRSGQERWDAAVRKRDCRA